MKRCCPACGSTTTETIEVCGAYQILRCSSCELSFCDPMEAGSVQYYADHFVYRKQCEPNNIAAVAAMIDTRRNRRLLRHVPPGGRLLDMGCGFGGFVKLALAHNIDAYGVDFNPAAIEAGRLALGLGDRLTTVNIEHGYNECGISSFDAITLFEVIEHVPDPKVIVTAAARILKSGGTLMVSCPNEERWMPTGRIFADYPPHHLTRWRPATLRRFIEAHGFRHVRTYLDCSLRDLLWVAYCNRQARLSLESSPRPHDPQSSSGRVGYSRRAKQVADTIARAIVLPFDLCLSALNVGTMGMVLLARKESE